MGPVLQQQQGVGYVEEPMEIETHHEPAAHGVPISQPTLTGRTTVSRETNPTVRRRSTVRSRRATGRAGNDAEKRRAEDGSEDILELPWVSEFAHGRPIDLSIQFTLWWTPFLVLLGWWTERPMHLLFGTSVTVEGPYLSSMENPS